MTTVAEMARRFRGIDLDAEAGAAMRDDPKAFLDVQRAQMMKGLDSRGKKIRRYRNRHYAAKKHQMNAAPGLGTPDLRLTGAFQRSLSLHAGGSSAEVIGNDDKTGDLLAAFGEDILGLNEESKDQYRNESLNPALARRIAAKTGAQLG